MNEKEKRIQEITPNPEGYNITIFPEFWTGVISVAIPIVLIYVFLGVLKPLFSSLNIWLAVGVFCILFFILVCLSLFCISRLTKAKVNIRLTNVGLEQRKLSGPFWIPEIRIVRWEDMSYFFLFGKRRGGPAVAFNGNDFYIGMKRCSDYSFSSIAFFRCERELKMVMKSFRTEFLQLAGQYGLERKKLWEEKQDSFDKKHLWCF